MNDITEITYKLLPVLDAAIQLATRYMKLQPLQQAVHNIQLSLYWFKTAEKELEALQGTNTLSTTTEPTQVNTKAPTLLGSTDYFNYLNSRLAIVNQELLLYKEDTVLPPNVKYNIDRGYDKLMESKFNIQLAEMYYGELNRATR